MVGFGIPLWRASGEENISRICYYGWVRLKMQCFNDVVEHDLLFRKVTGCAFGTFSSGAIQIYKASTINVARMPCIASYPKLCRCVHTTIVCSIVLCKKGLGCVLI